MIEQAADRTSWQVSAISSFFLPISFTFKHIKYCISRLSIIQILPKIKYRHTKIHKNNTMVTYITFKCLYLFQNLLFFFLNLDRSGIPCLTLHTHLWSAASSELLIHTNKKPHCWINIWKQNKCIISHFHNSKLGEQVLFWLRFPKTFTFGPRMKHETKCVFKMMVVWKYGGVEGCELLRGLDSVLLTGVGSHHSIWSIWDKNSAVPQICRCMSPQNLDARLEHALQAMILRGISALHPINSTLSLNSEKHLTASLAWNVHSAFLDWAHAAKTTSPTAELQVPLGGNTAALHSTTTQRCRAGKGRRISHLKSNCRDGFKTAECHKWISA